MRLLRGALPAALILIGLSVVTSTLGPVSFVAVANAQTASNIVVEGNRRVEADTVRSYFRRNWRRPRSGPDR